MHGHDQEHDHPRQPLRADRLTEQRNVARTPEPLRQHGRDKDTEQGDVDETAKAEPLAVGRRAILRGEPAIEQIEEGEQHARDHQQLQIQVGDRPEERHSAQEPEIERRVAERGCRPARVRDQQDEEHDKMHLAGPVRVCPKQGMDQHHRRARRAHDAGQSRAYRQRSRIAGRGSRPAAPQQNASARGEEGKEQGHEGQILREDRMPCIVRRRADTTCHGLRNQQGECPEQSDQRPCAGATAARPSMGRRAIESRIPRNGMPQTRPGAGPRAAAQAGNRDEAAAGETKRERKSSRPRMAPIRGCCRRPGSVAWPGPCP